jgi:hypothetical protein
MSETNWNATLVENAIDEMFEMAPEHPKSFSAIHRESLPNGVVLESVTVSDKIAKKAFPGLAEHYHRTPLILRRIGTTESEVTRTVQVGIKQVMRRIVEVSFLGPREVNAGSQRNWFSLRYVMDDSKLLPVTDPSTDGRRLLVINGTPAPHRIVIPDTKSGLLNTPRTTEKPEESGDENREDQNLTDERQPSEVPRRSFLFNREWWRQVKELRRAKNQTPASVESVSREQRELEIESQRRLEFERKLQQKYGLVPFAGSRERGIEERLRNISSPLEESAEIVLASEEQQREIARQVADILHLARNPSGPSRSWLKRLYKSLHKSKSKKLPQVEDSSESGESGI